MSSSRPELTLRRPRPDDVEAVCAVLAAYDERFGLGLDFGVDDLRDGWRTLDLERDAWVWEPGGRVVAYAALHVRGGRLTVDGYVHPEFAGQGLGRAIAEETEARARERGATVLENAVIAADRDAVSLLETRGYREVRHYYQMAIEMNTPPPAPEWPGSLEPSAFEDEHARAFHAAAEEAGEDEWGHEPEPFDEFRRRRLESPRFDPTLWTAVWDGQEIAATAMCDWKRFGAGWIGWIGVRRPWRRRGLGLALLRHAFGQFYERGERRVLLGVDAENPSGATRLYERAGMHVAWQATLFRKELR